MKENVRRLDAVVSKKQSELTEEELWRSAVAGPADSELMLLFDEFRGSTNRTLRKAVFSLEETDSGRFVINEVNCYGIGEFGSNAFGAMIAFQKGKPVVVPLPKREMEVDGVKVFRLDSTLMKTEISQVLTPNSFFNPLGPITVTNTGITVGNRRVSFDNLVVEVLTKGKSQ